MCGFVCGKVVELVDYYAVEEVFASYCNQSAAPLGVFGVVVSSGYESIAQGVQEVVEVFFGDGVSGRAVYATTFVFKIANDYIINCWEILQLSELDVSPGTFRKFPLFYTSDI